MLAKAATVLKDGPEVRCHYGAALARSGDKARAIQELKSALALNKSFPDEMTP